jgi:hypothetical protein
LGSSPSVEKEKEGTAGDEDEFGGESSLKAKVGIDGGVG